VYGRSTTGNGLVGLSADNGHSGVSGENTGSGNGVYGSINPSGAGAAIYGENNNVFGFAGYFHGDVTVTGSFSNPSDARLKTNIQPLVGALDQVLQLRGVTFEWRDPADHAGLTGTQRGFVAQDIEKVFPNWVSEDPHGFKTVDTRGVDALLVESVRALRSENDILRAQSAKVEDRLKALEESRRPVVTGLGTGGAMFGLGFIGLGGAFMISRRKRSEAGYK
jgi:hypothetical protein